MKFLQLPYDIILYIGSFLGNNSISEVYYEVNSKIPIKLICLKTEHYNIKKSFDHKNGKPTGQYEISYYKHDQRKYVSITSTKKDIQKYLSENDPKYFKLVKHYENGVIIYNYEKIYHYHLLSRETVWSETSWLYSTMFLSDFMRIKTHDKKYIAYFNRRKSKALIR